MGVHCSLSLVCVQPWQPPLYQSPLLLYIWPQQSLVTGMEDTAMSTELLRDSLRVTMVKDLLSLVMVTVQESAITTEVPREFKAMVMEVTTRDLLSLVMVITMVMDTLMSTRTVIIIMDLMDMKLIMITKKDLLRLSLVTGMEVIAMSTEPLRDLLKVIMARDPLSPVMVTPLELAITTEVPREFKDMVMEVTTRERLSLVMVIIMVMANHMYTRTVTIIMDLMDMRSNMITRSDLLMLVMKEKVTSMSADHTLTIKLRFTIPKPTITTIKL